MFGKYVKAFNWVTDRIDQVSSWLKRKNRRNDVQGMDKDVDNNNIDAISDKLCKLKQARKDKDDSR